ncbi:TetR/AcrR family transcriptional regulator [Afifella sp. IM 167]|uniref:TetR/AcrR family transcriptional regulator n=1 Tax=Afifella sp. IM 167 TaxID=2033586 RepID=UPI001CCC65D8|nr:TetR/AcrR family transcriptional regulator [Afifella sp. IM 167]MBZ8132942.1 TetR family transcriptional regulator [Afifella sp. IM 167]
MIDRDAIIASAEAVLDREGFSATGMDRLIKAAGVSSRTLYKHVGGRAGLILAALEAREERFFAAVRSDGVEELFRSLAEWVETEGAHGCFFLRALGEAGASDPSIAERVRAHKEATAGLIEACVAKDLGREDALLAAQILVLLEGATHAAVYRGASAVEAAGEAAATLLEAARGGPERAGG